jgi:hypothetical protein
MPVIQLTRAGLTADAGDIAALREEFAQHHCVRLPRLLAPDVLQGLLPWLAAAPFVETPHHFQDEQGGTREFARDLTIAGSSPVLHALHWLLNAPALFAVIEQITGSARIGCFSGRIYRSLPGSRHHLDWHDDRAEADRLVGLSLSLSEPPYEGGVFQIRERGARRLTAEVACQGAGSAHLFRIAPSVEHRVTAVVGPHPRTVAAGWFLSRPSREALLKSLYAG